MEQSERARERILVVDDQEMLRAIIRRVLMQGGYDVAEAGDGDEAIAKQKEGDRPFDLVLMDVQMPGLSGREALARMRAWDPALPALLLSGTLNEFGAEQERELENVDFLPKPFENQQLLAKVREILDR